MHKVCGAFVKCKSSDRTKQAINHINRRFNDVWFNNGDHVYHKQEINSKWRGPGTVTGQGHNQVFVRHGSELVRVHSSRHVDNVNFEKSSSSNESNNHTDNVNEVPNSLIRKLQCRSFKDTASEETNQENDNLIHLEEEVLPNSEENSEVEQLSSDEEARPEEEEMTEGEEESLNERSLPAEVIEDQSERERGMEQNIVLPKVTTKISYHLIHNCTWRKSVLHSKSDKVARAKAGKHRNCLNVIDEASDKIKWYDFGKDIEEW